MKHYALNNESICDTPGEITTTAEDITCPDCQRLAPPSMNPYLLIKWARFIPNYAPGVRNLHKKLAGRVSFTEADKAAINAGMGKYIKALQSAVFGFLLLLVACGKSVDPPVAKPVETSDNVWVQDMTLHLTTHHEPFNRAYNIQVEMLSGKYKVTVEVPAGHVQGILQFVGEQPSNPKILSVQQY